MKSMRNVRWWKYSPLLVVVALTAVLVGPGCQKGPFGRTQIIRMSPEQESKLGSDAYEQITTQARQKGQLVDGGPVVNVVKRIGLQLAEASKKPEFRAAIKLPNIYDFKWDFRVIDSKQINAFCLPGGKVMVYTGILPVAENEFGLAVVMGHEIGHALARHGAERMAQQELVQVGQLALSVSLRNMSPEKQRTVMGVFGAGAALGILLPYSRANESEADHIGVLLMATAGYNPSEAPKMWMRMSKASSGGPPEFASTHPSHETRIRDLENWIESQPVQQLYSAATKQKNALLPGIAKKPAELLR